MIWIGTSGWMYRDWNGRFYPAGLPARDQLAFYTRRFPTVEINRSFYRWPTRDNFAAWAEQAAARPGFRFAVKASRFLTHMKKLSDADEPLRRQSEAVAGLGAVLGPVLYQLPPRWRVNEARLAAFIAALPPGQPAAFEFRDPSWYTPPVLDRLARSGCALVVPVWGANPAPSDAVVAGPFRYLRFHHGAYGTGLTDGELDAWTPRILAEAADHEVYIYFNNDPDGHAIVDAERLRDRLLAAGAPVAT